MGYLVPDLTASSPEYKESNHLVQIFTNNQIIEFDCPVYEHTIQVNKILDSGTTVELVKNQDWVVNEIDQTSMGEIKLNNPDWDYTLVKSIKIINSSNESFKIQLIYQRLYPKLLDYTYYHGYTQVELTPETFLALMDQVSYLQSLLDTQFLLEKYEIDMPKTRILQLDIHKQNPDNLIENEEHDVNYYDNKLLIIPVYGSFFKDSVAVKDENGVVWQEGTDYTIEGLDYVKTKITSNTSGVYNYIKILKKYVGKVYITYHAFGGIPSTSNYYELMDKVFQVINFLKSNNFITSNGLRVHPVIIDMYNRITKMEADMRILLSGQPNYSDVTDTTAVTRKLKALDDKINWWTIAKLYKVQGSDDVCLADTCTYKIQLYNQPLIFEIGCGFNKNLDIKDQLSVKVISESANLDVIEKCKPHVRIIYKNMEGIWSGALLQIGLSLPDVIYETIGVEDRSGSESCFILVPGSATAEDPQNTNIQLPSGDIWYGVDPNIDIELRLPLIFEQGSILGKYDSPIDVITNNTEYTLAYQYTLSNLAINKINDIQLDTKIITSTNQYNINIKNFDYTVFDDRIELYKNVIDPEGNRYFVTIKLYSEEGKIKIDSTVNNTFQIFKLRIFY